MSEPFQLTAPVAVAREVDGIEMGVLEDGSPYLTGRGLASLCGVAPSAIIQQKNEWAAGNRTSKLAKLLADQGFDEKELCTRIVVNGTKVDAYGDQVCMLLLEYYGFEVSNPSDTARQYFRKLARSTLRLFIYRALGYDPDVLIPRGWREIHDRLLLHSEPSGYFSVFKEAVNIVIAAVKAGLRVDHHTVPDISIGIAWAKYWADNPKLAKKFGQRIKHEHNYPDYFPQSDSNPQDINVYPVDALGEFRRWLESEYLCKKFPTYLGGKVKQGLMPAKSARRLLAEINGDAPHMLE